MHEICCNINVLPITVLSMSAGISTLLLFCMCHTTFSVVIPYFLDIFSPSYSIRSVSYSE